MKSLLKAFLLITSFVTVVSSSYGQNALLEKFRFEEGGYSFVGIFSHHSDHPLQKKLGEFYTDDIAVLNALKKAWVFRKPQRDYACGYHYQMLLLKEGSVKESFAINLECNQLRSQNASLFFDHKKLDAFRYQFKPIRREEREFPSVIEARDYLNTIKTNSDFIYAQPPRWLNYEGEFRFNLKCPPDVKNCNNYDEFPKIEPKLRAEISKMYPDENFELKPGGGSSGGELFVIIKCNKKLEESFDLYDRWNREAFGKWEPYYLNLYSYWKAKSKG